MTSSPLAVIILTYNEEANLPACLESLRGLDCHVVVVDSGSTDRTVEIARAAGAEVVHHPFETHATQWAWALSHLPWRAEWVLGLDADQRLSPELRQELARLFSSERQRLRQADGFYLTRRQVFCGRWIRHGGYYPKRLLKLFRPERVRLDERDLVDHHFVVDGPVGRLRGDLIEENRKEDDLVFWLQKHAHYAALHAREELARRDSRAAWPLQPSLFGSPDQRTMWLKQRWYGLPLYLRPFLYFLYRYILRLGFLDGTEGLIFHFLQGCWYRFLVDVYLDQLRRQAAPVAAPERATPHA
ncbi:MAG TPA: glycosyltransferase family 2 protein [Roseiflexaceae bacterium]|nr:glycosyltransferase family 2 protein [Roseiflexaceae bacterium]